MKRTAASRISPVLMELIVVILFFGLSCSVLVRLLAASSEMSTTARLETEAIVALQDVAEQVKSDPAGDGEFTDGVRAFTVDRNGGLSVQVTVTRHETAAGSYYHIALTALDEAGVDISALTAGRYVPRTEAAG